MNCVKCWREGLDIGGETNNKMRNNSKLPRTKVIHRGGSFLYNFMSQNVFKIINYKARSGTVLLAKLKALPTEISLRFPPR